MSSRLSRSSSSSSLESKGSSSTSKSSKKIETHWLLNDYEFLGTVCKQSKEMVDFPSLLYTYFDVNDKGSDLMNWAIEKEIKEAKDMNSLLADESIALRLIDYHFYGDLGSRYLSSSLSPTLHEIVVVCEKDKTENEENVPTKKKVVWMIGLLKTLLESLERDVFECPILIRESFSQLYKTLDKMSIANPLELTSRALFVNFILPALSNPLDYSFFEEKTNSIYPKTRKMFQLASQILESVISGSIDYNVFGFGCELVKDFSSPALDKIKHYTSLLMDEKDLKMSKAVISAASTSITKEKKHQAVESLRVYLENRKIDQKIESVVNYKHKFDQLLALYNSSDWKLAKASKRDGIIAYVKRLEGSDIVSFKTVSRFKADFDVATECLNKSPEFYLLDARVTESTVLKKYADNDYEWMFIIKPTFPVAGREWYLSFHSKLINENLFSTLNYSIPSDQPVRKRYVRGEMMLNGHIIERDPQDPTYITYSYILHMDIKGSVPTWMFNRTAGDNIAGMKAFINHMREMSEQKKKIEERGCS